MADESEKPPYLRQTSTPLRAARPRSSPAPFRFIVAFAIVAALAFGAWTAVRGGSGQELSATAIANCVSGCAPAAVDVRAQTVATVAATPCAYCGQDPNRWQQLASKPPPALNSRASAVIEASCGTMVFGTNENAQLPPASLTKMVTALVALDRAKPSDVLDIKLNGWDLAADDGSSIMGLEAGMRLSVQDLIYGMMLVSGNDAAIALADGLGGQQRFVQLMNDRVRQLGLKNTHFTDADGRDSPGHYSSALDMALIGRAVLQNPLLKTAVNTRTYKPNWDGRTLSNTNEMIWVYPDAVGVKIGYTEAADFTIVTGMERNGRLLIAAVMGAQHLYADAYHLLLWALDNTKPAC
jgi:D-alanyl-D-alanine carboxypeptidase